MAGNIVKNVRVDVNSISWNAFYENKSTLIFQKILLTNFMNYKARKEKENYRIENYSKKIR